MDLGGGLVNLGRMLVGMMATFGALAFLVGLGYKLLVVVMHGGDERVIRKEGLGAVVMAVAFSALVGLAGWSGANFGWLPGPAQAVLGVGNLIWNALYSAFQGAAAAPPAV